MPEMQTGAKTFLLKSQRAAGVLPSFTLGFGYQDDLVSPTRSADQIAGCKIDTLEMSLEAGDGSGPLSANFTGFGRPPTVLTSLAPAVLTSTTWAAYEGVMTRAGSAYEVRSWSLSLNNGLKRNYVIPGATPGSNIRGPKYLTEHDREISGSITRYQRSGIDVQADCPVPFAMVLTLTNLCDSVVLTLTYTDVVFGEEQLAFSGDGFLVTVPYVAKSLVIS